MVLRGEREREAFMKQTVVADEQEQEQEQEEEEEEEEWKKKERRVEDQHTAKKEGR